MIRALTIPAVLASALCLPTTVATAPDPAEEPFHPAVTSHQAEATNTRRGVISGPQAAASILLREAGTNEHGHLRLDIDRAALTILMASESEVVVPVPISATEKIHLGLKPFQAIMPEARFTTVNERGDEIDLPRPNVLMLRGSIAGEHGSRAYLALSERGGGMGTITFPSGRRMQIDTERNIDGAPTGLVVRPAGAEMPDVPELCRLIHPDKGQDEFAGACCTAHADNSRADGTPLQPDTLYRGPRLLTIAIEGDQQYVELFANEDDAIDYTVMLIGAVSDIYLNDLNFSVMVEQVRLWPLGAPFGAHSLSGFRSWWLANNSMDGINLVHLFSGRRDLSYGGVAYLANACSSFAFAISGFLNGDFPDPVQFPHLGNWDIVVVAHEIGHNLGSAHTHNYGIDSCASGQNIRGTIMSYCHINQGGLLNIDLSMHTYVANVIAENNPQNENTCLFYDCNGNGIDDAEDIASGFSKDEDGNGIPDECEDCTGTGVLHSVLIAMGVPDVNNNGVPDICEPDCTGTGIPDSWEIEQGWIEDLNGNGIPDICEPDCDGNGVPDFLDILEGTHTDYDRNAVPDICQDCLGNGVPDWIDLERQFHMFIGLENGAVREYHRDSGVYMQTLGSGVVNRAYDLVFNEEDRLLYVASFQTHEIIRIDPDAGTADVFIPAGAGGLNQPSSLTFGPNGNLFVAGQSADNVLEFDGETGAFIADFVASGSGGLVDPWSIRFGPNDNLFVASANNRILEYDGSTGAFVGTVADGQSGNVSGPRGLAFLPNDDLLVVNNGNNTIARYNSSGQYLGVFNDGYAITSPWGIVVGPNGTVFIARNISPVRIVEYTAEEGRYIR